MAFKPLHDRVLVKRVEGDEKTKGGLIIPDTAKEKPAEGEVVAVGEGARKDSGELIAPSVKAGDRSCSANGRAPKSRSTAKSC
jgi:chaperonin GroES